MQETHTHLDMNMTVEHPDDWFHPPHPPTPVTWWRSLFDGRRWKVLEKMFQAVWACRPAASPSPPPPPHRSNINVANKHTGACKEKKKNYKSTRLLLWSGATSISMATGNLQPVSLLSSSCGCTWSQQPKEKKKKSFSQMLIFSWNPQTQVIHSNRG